MKSESFRHAGVFIALTVISLWFVSLHYLLNWNFAFSNPVVYLFVLLQMHLYTGLFITAHDGMHRTISANKELNNWIGRICTLLYAAFPFGNLNRKHHRHHKFVHSEQDPDYSEGGFFKWYIKFIAEYLSIWQIVTLAIVFNLLKIWFEEKNLLLFWVLPSLLSTLQLFYFGTWLPHHGEHLNKHHSRSQRRNHVWAFLSCYFFGYHYEHHEAPQTPWWMLWREKSVGGNR